MRVLMIKKGVSNSGSNGILTINYDVVMEELKNDNTPDILIGKIETGPSPWKRRYFYCMYAKERFDVS